MLFENLGLAPDLVRAVADQGYTTPTPIQQKAVPLVLDGHDLLAAAQTGTGKTGAFALPTLQRLAFVGRARSKQVRALVLAPTRELALQVYESVSDYARHLDLNCAVVFGGVKLPPQIRALKPGVDLLVATPGRLIDLSNQGALHFDDLEVLILDEADRMLDMGFIHDLRRIVDRLPKQRQTLMFSATFSQDIRRLAGQFLDNPKQVEVAPANTATELVEQIAYHVDKEQKTPLLLHLLREHQWERVLVFTRTKHGANRLSRRLEKEGFKTAPIHGNKSQNARQRALEDFKAGRLQVLVATDIAARGLDIEELPEVMNYDLPAVAEDYVHRIGRTGRAGSTGRSHSLTSAEDVALLRAIERLIGRRIAAAEVPGFTRPAPEPASKAPAKPRNRQGNRSNASRRDGGGSRAGGRASGKGGGGGRKNANAANGSRTRLSA